MNEKRKIRWLIAHYPAHLFQRTADAFSKELEKLLPGQFELEIHTAESYVKQYNKLGNLLIKRANIKNLEENLTSNEDTVAVDTSPKWETLFNGLRNGDIESLAIPLSTHEMLQPHMDTPGNMGNF